MYKYSYSIIAGVNVELFQILISTHNIERIIIISILLRLILEISIIMVTFVRWL